ncbi:MAG: tetratricopeptide repeat protein [Pirellula sp.]
MTAPMHVWKAAQVPKPGLVRIAVAPIGGTTDATERLLNAMQRAQPQPSPVVAAVYPKELSQIGGIQLVSFDNQPNDMATLSSSRRAGMDYILQGNILESELDIPPPDPNEKKRFRIFKTKEKLEHLTVRWTIVDVKTGERINEKTVSVDRKQAEKLYPDLTMHTQSADGRVLLAAARQSWSFVAPTTNQEQATLDLPWFSYGSSQVRKGNGFARQGNWELAEREWQNVAKLHPRNTAAWNNLSLAAVAREDFQLARDRLKHADTMWPGDSTFPTLAWIEQRQRDYHQSMDLAAPVAGWSLADTPKSVRPEEVPASPPRDLNEMPWWTIFPFVPPPGWTWKQWWTQPIVL